MALPLNEWLGVVQGKGPNVWKLAYSQYRDRGEDGRDAYCEFTLAEDKPGAQPTVVRAYIRMSDRVSESTPHYNLAGTVVKIGREVFDPPLEFISWGYDPDRRVGVIKIFESPLVSCTRCGETHKRGIDCPACLQEHLDAGRT